MEVVEESCVLLPGLSKKGSFCPHCPLSLPLGRLMLAQPQGAFVKVWTCSIPLRTHFLL